MVATVTLKERKYTAAEAAPLIGLRTARSVTRYCQLNKMPGAYRVGRDWLIPESAIKNFINKQMKRKTGRAI